MVEDKFDREYPDEFGADQTYLHPSSPKVIALYDAVSALSREGADLTQLKVSDIAAKAGIGKGTTYAYFKSREELIVKAILYNLYHHMQIIRNRILQADSFREKVYVTLDTLFEEKKYDKNLFQRLMPFFYDVSSFPARFREEFIKWAPDINKIEGIAAIILEAAVKEGLVQRGVNIFYVRTAFFNTVLNYAIYQQQSCCEKMNPRLSEEEVKQRLYENLIYMLRKSE